MLWECWIELLKIIYIYIYVFSRRFYPKRLTMHSDYTFFISMCVPWELNPHPFQISQIWCWCRLLSEVWSWWVLISVFCRVSSLSQHLLNLQTWMMISSVLSSLLMIWENLFISWETNWRISAKRSSRRSQTEVKSWRFICSQKPVHHHLISWRTSY